MERSFPLGWRRLLPCLMLALVTLVGATAEAQDLEPRSFSQAPTGMNFAFVALGHAEGNMLFDVSSSLTIKVSVASVTSAPSLVECQAMNATSPSRSIASMVNS